jgi:hypothetical protein
MMQPARFESDPARNRQTREKLQRNEKQPELMNAPFDHTCT